ncbi:MAG: BrnT family toxin [Chlorobiaceae bacterium]
MFEWDEDKRLLNLKKHHLDFIDARLFFDGRNTIPLNQIISMNSDISR